MKSDRHGKPMYLRLTEDNEKAIDEYMNASGVDKSKAINHNIALGVVIRECNIPAHKLRQLLKGYERKQSNEDKGSGLPDSFFGVGED